MGKCIELTGRNLSASDVCNIARGLCKVSVSTEAIERLVESRKLVFELSDKGVPIYGCNRGVGWNKDKKVTKEFVSQFNKNMLHSHSVGVGESASIEEARGAMVIRLNNLLVGCRNDAAIMFVLGNINSNKVHGHRKNLLNKYFSTVVFHREFGCVIT